MMSPVLWMMNQNQVLSGDATTKEMFDDNVSDDATEEMYDDTTKDMFDDNVSDDATNDENYKEELEVNDECQDITIMTDRNNGRTGRAGDK